MSQPELSSNSMKEFQEGSSNSPSESAACAPGLGVVFGDNPATHAYPTKGIVVGLKGKTAVERLGPVDGSKGVKGVAIISILTKAHLALELRSVEQCPCRLFV